MDYLELQEWESKSTLESHLKYDTREFLLIGNEAEAPNKFYSISLDSMGMALEVGLLSSGLGITPSAICEKNRKILVVGSDTTITGINIVMKTIVFTMLLNGAFFEFFNTQIDNGIVIIHELGVVKIDYTGVEIWTVDTDVIEKYYVDDTNRLNLETMGNERKIAIDLDSGRYLQV